MIVVLMALLSLCAISFIHLLYEKQKKVGAIAVSVLYICLIIWVYTVFIIDVANFGFKDTRCSDLVGSSIFHSFTDLRNAMEIIPQSIHFATAVFAILIALFVIVELLISSIRICSAIIKLYKKKTFSLHKRISLHELIPERIVYYRRIYLLHCRFNN